MKALSRRLISVLLVICMISCMIIPASAANGESGVAPAASAYIDVVWAEAVGGSGTLTVNFSISATGNMTSLGATQIQIVNASGNTVKTFYSSSTGGMTGYSRSYYSSHVTWYSATAGKYYAIVYYQATNSSGHDTSSYVTAYTYVS